MQVKGVDQVTFEQSVVVPIEVDSPDWILLRYACELFSIWEVPQRGDGTVVTLPRGHLLSASEGRASPTTRRYLCVDGRVSLRSPSTSAAMSSVRSRSGATSFRQRDSRVRRNVRSPIVADGSAELFLGEAGRRSMLRASRSLMFSQFRARSTAYDASHTDLLGRLFNGKDSEVMLLRVLFAVP